MRVNSICRDNETNPNIDFLCYSWRGTMRWVAGSTGAPITLTHLPKVTPLPQESCPPPCLATVIFLFFRSDLLFFFNVHFALVFPTFFSGEVFGIFPWSGTPESLLAFPDRITDVKTVRFNDQVSDHDGVVVNVDLKCAFGEHDLMVSMKVVYDVADTMAAGIERQRVDE